jgi:putative ABC transport system ATP-binding protein
VIERAAIAALIEFRDVTRAFRQGGREVTALRGVTESVAAGEFVAVTGPSGSGKSTFLHLAGGLDLPTSGDVLIGGVATRGLGDVELSRVRRTRIGFVFQFFNLVPTLTVAENVALPRLIAGERSEAAWGDVERLLREVGLVERAHHLPEELSGGEMQRVAIARALVMSPEIVLADEPTGNLDSATGAEVLRLLETVARSRTVVMVTHDAAAAAIARRQIRLRDGRLATQPWAS